MNTTIETANLIKEKLNGFTPRLGMILGSGLGRVAESITNPIIFNYNELPGFPGTSVAGHQGRLVVGELNGAKVACLQGRTHRYEGENAAQQKCIVRCLKLIGCQELLITNASGSINPNVFAGELMLITDHINLSFNNPLVGPNDEEFGERFVSMEDAYDPALREVLKKNARELNIKLAEGIYMGVLGPTFETPAEINAFRVLGADAVGMSTVPDVIVARHCGLKVALVAAITNQAAGLNPEPLSHEGTLKYGQIAAEDLSRLVCEFAGNFSDAK